MQNKLTIVRAEPSQAKELTEIAYAAKAYWQYPEAWFTVWRERGSLEVSETFIEKYPTFAAFYKDECVGFCSLIVQVDKAVLEHLFVKPSSIGKGVGKFLFRHAQEQAKQLGAHKLSLEADPNAKDFYEHMGMKQTGEKKSMVLEVERVLPIMEMEL